MSPEEALYEYKNLQANCTKHVQDFRVFRVKSKISDHHWAIAASSSSAALTYGLSLLKLEGISITWPKQKSRYLSTRAAPDLAHLLPSPDVSSNTKYQLLACLGPDGEPAEHQWENALQVYGKYIAIPVGSSAPNRISPAIQRQRTIDSVRRHFFNDCNP